MRYPSIPRGRGGRIISRGEEILLLFIFCAFMNDVPIEGSVMRWFGGL
jgi:hypothetical protein